MLKNLTIQNIVLIDKAEIDFSEMARGLCILTGETGSGKSLLLDAFGLAIGFRSNLRLIGNQQNRALVSAEFDISTNEICKNLLQEHCLIDEENPNSLRIRRIIQENSSSKVHINDNAVGVNLLAEIGETLVEIHGQHDQRGLLNPAFHQVILDEFSLNSELLNQLKKLYEELKNCDEKIAAFEAKKAENEREKDYLLYIIKELEEADIKPNEENELITKKDFLIGKKKILKFLDELKINFLESNSNLILAQKILLRNQNIIDNYLNEQKDAFEKLTDETDLHNSMLDAAIEKISTLEKSLNQRDENLDEIEERLLNIRSLARKFNTEIESLPTIIFESRLKLEAILQDSQNISETILQRLQLLEKYNKLADEISEKRKKSAIILAKKVEEELQFLKMENVKFLVEISKNETAQYSINGFDKIRFFASINKNNFDDIAKIASGGELSRFMLALKVALMNIKSVPTMIFDEIDTGIGGSTADAVGKRLKILAKNLQIFVVTHQPQIAAKADLHFKISKAQNNNEIKTMIKKLSTTERNNEIARMLSGEEITEEALAAAKSLIG